jgi:dTDP-4-dehydrorhamnose 3,5-epimerase
MRGVSLIESRRLSDSRGNFTKILTHDQLLNVPDFELEEVFVTKTIKGAIRGMHLQVDEASNWRVIQVLSGVAFDVLLDLRTEQPTYLSTQTNILSGDSPQTLLVPPGVAHGFQAIEDTEMLYLTSHRYNPELDKGVNPFSIGIEWPLQITAISNRDKDLPSLEEY